MAHFLRLIAACLVGLSCFAWVASAYASIPMLPGSYWWGSEPNWWPTKTQACAALSVDPYSALVPETADSDVTNGWCNGKWNGSYYTHLINLQRQGRPASCPENSTASGSSCVCAAGYVELGGTSCVIDNGCTSVMGMTPPNDGACQGGVCQYGYKVNAGEQATAQPYGRFCSSSCTVKGNLDFCGQYSSGVMVSGRGVCQISKSFYTGDKCTGSSEVSGPSSQGTDGGTSSDPTKVETAANPVPEKLPPGKCPGQVNGVDVVVTCGSTASNETKKEDGSTKNPDGSVTNNTTNNTTTTQTICNGNACQKITTVTSGGSGPNGTGPGSKTETKTESGTKSEMCAGSTAAACKGDDDKKPTGFGGSCAGGYKAVSEDAVLNAMAEEQYRRNCQLLDTSGGEASEVGTEMAKTGNRTGDSGNNSTVNVGPGSFDTSNALGGGACNIDKTVNVWRGYSVTLPFSNACNFLLWMGNLGVACALLLAARIVARG